MVYSSRFHNRDDIGAYAVLCVCVCSGGGVMHTPPGISLCVEISTKTTKPSIKLNLNH